MKKVLTIAGSDSCGGAGIQADLKTFAANGVYGMSVITAVTAQNTQGVMAVQNINIKIIEKQMEAIFEDINVDAVKIGMVSCGEAIKSIARAFDIYHPKKSVLDPVMISKSGYKLLQLDAIQILKDELIPRAYLVTPNLPEAEVLTGNKIKSIEDMKKCACDMYQMGAKKVLIKGGHLSLDPIDVFYDGTDYVLFHGERLSVINTHGTGCTLSSAIASKLALGLDIIEAVKQAKAYINQVISHALSIGKGIGPTHHFYDLYRKAGLDV